MNMHRPDPEARRIAALIEEIETLREENRQLRELLTPPIRVPEEWGLTLSEERLLSALQAAGTRTVTHERALTATCDREEDLPERQILSVLVSRVRKKLGRAGLPTSIETVRAEGYRLTDRGLAALNVALKTEADPHSLASVTGRGR